MNSITKYVLLFAACLPACGPPEIDCCGDSGDFTVEMTSDVCHTDARPHDWAEGLSDLWVHSCTVVPGDTRVSCCLAAWVLAGHIATLEGASADGPLSWYGAPVGLSLDGIEPAWLSSGHTMFGRVEWEYCGLPEFETRWVELTVKDNSIGSSSSELIEIELAATACY